MGFQQSGTLNADNFCAGESCGDTKEIAPGWQGAPSDKRLAAAFGCLEVLQTQFMLKRE